MTDPARLDFDSVSGVAETLDADAARGEVIHQLETDGEFFLEFFIPEQLSMPVPRFHSHEIWPCLHPPPCSESCWRFLGDTQRQRWLS